MTLKETQKAIKFVKDTFQKYLVKKLNLLRVTAPLFVKSNSGLNDGLSGFETPIEFRIENIKETVEIVHSLAKWKRYALGKYQMDIGEGLYTDMNAIRKDEKPDFYHSVYVDQWDWEIVISEHQRTYKFLKQIVRKIYSCIYHLCVDVEKNYPELKNRLPKEITFISSSKLEKLYPNEDRKTREKLICKKHGAVFLYQIGHNLKDGKPHDLRAADYDDWKLNGDILVYDSFHDIAYELSSMGIRVDKEALINQLNLKNENYKLDNYYCQSLINNKLPLTIGGGIGQSRMCMFVLQKKHIGEVQVSIWSDEEIELCKNSEIKIL